MSRDRPIKVPDLLATEPRTLPAHLSVSQASTYAECGTKYYLTKIDPVAFEYPAFWNLGGSAVHDTLEAFERDFAVGTVWTPEDAKLDFLTRFRDAVADHLKVFPELNDWRAAKGGKEDGVWWGENGAAMVGVYVNRRMAETDGRRILLLPDGQLGLELEVKLEVPYLDGTLEIQGFIDQVWKYDNGDLLVRDLKAGARSPGDTFQLGTYGHGLRALVGDGPIIYGDYLMLRRHQASAYIEPESEHPMTELAFRYGMTEKGRQAGVFTPNVTSFCISCGVRAFCPVQGDLQAQQKIDKMLS